MDTEKLRTCNQQLNAVLDAVESARSKLRSVEYHSAWVCAERNAMYDNVQAALDSLDEKKNECRELEEATTYLIEKMEEAAIEARWKLDANKSSFSPQSNLLSEIANELQGNSTLQIRMEKF